MKQKIKALLIIFFLLTATNTFAAFQQVPEDLFDPWYVKVWNKFTDCGLNINCYRVDNLGAFTEISTATQISAFPSIYNANLAKTIEVGTTSIDSITTLDNLTTAGSLATIGTITSGTWNGTAIGVAYNGTGTTSPTNNAVMVGAGSSGFKTIGFGTSGQFLTSQGTSSAPQWTTSSIDQTANYTWTGLHIFNSATTTLNSTTSIAADTSNNLILNGVSYAFPSSDGTSGQFLQTDALGNLSFADTFATLDFFVPEAMGNIGVTTKDLSDTQFRYGHYYFPVEIAVDKVTLEVTTVSNQGDIDISCYTSDGQTKMFTFTQGSGVGAGFITATGATTTLSANTLYICGTNLNDGADDVTIRVYDFNINAVTGERTLSSDVNITSGTPPSSFTPETTSPADYAPVLRFN